MARRAHAAHALRSAQRGARARARCPLAAGAGRGVGRPARHRGQRAAADLAHGGGGHHPLGKCGLCRSGGPQARRGRGPGLAPARALRRRGRACLRIEAGPNGRAEAATDVWVDLHAFPAGAGEMVFALPADAAVRAEANMRAFLLTLTRAFAHLPIGLAIFDPQRRLQLFNPALSDLTQLPPEFLSGRPTLYAVFDAMRDRRMVPEPRDYKGWRQRIAALETSPEAGDMQETWLLPGGTTYRMTARPQADGALALLIEDITDEMARSRTDRASLEVSQSVIDALEEGIAVFDQDGRRVMSNAALAALWGEGPEMVLPEADLQGMVALWQAGCAPDPVWSRIAAFVTAAGERQGWTAEVRHLDGRALRLRIVGLRGGATLIGFDARHGAPVFAQRAPRRAPTFRDRATGTG
ncbi:MAG: PAS domain-containing protein [Alphaproteobacteria bacterium]|nr:PAS domain-containing protein [Alphaproteobacteria bacterium]